jgi:hypothetical protein
MGGSAGVGMRLGMEGRGSETMGPVGAMLSVREIVRSAVEGVIS